MCRYITVTSFTEDKGTMSDTCIICTEEFDGAHTVACCRQTICVPCLLRLEKAECPFCRSEFNFEDESWGDKAEFLKDAFAQKRPISITIPESWLAEAFARTTFIERVFTTQPWRNHRPSLRFVESTDDVRRYREMHARARTEAISRALEDAQLVSSRDFPHLLVAEGISARTHVENFISATIALATETRRQSEEHPMIHSWNIPMSLPRLPPSDFDGDEISMFPRSPLRGRLRSVVNHTPEEEARAAETINELRRMRQIANESSASNSRSVLQRVTSDTLSTSFNDERAIQQAISSILRHPVHEMSLPTVPSAIATVQRPLSMSRQERRMFEMEHRQRGHHQRR